jgi:transcriptional regulator with XRE-family HTH domain
MEKKKLVDLINEEISKRNLSIRDFAKLVGVSHPTISAILNGDTPTYDVCVKLAPVLHISLANTLQIAGLLPNNSIKSEKQDKLLYFFNQLPENLQMNIIRYVQLQLDIYSETKKQ